MEKSSTTYAFWEALEHFFEESGWTKKEFAYRAKIGKSTVTELLQRKIGRKPNLQEKVARAFGYELIDFLDAGRRILSGEPEKPPAEPLAACGIAAPEAYCTVPLYESGRLAAGASGLAFDPYERPSRDLVVYAPELNHRARHRLRAVRVGGVSMEPLIPQGSVVVVDMDDREYADGRLYCVAAEEAGVELVAAVKRVRRMNSAFVLYSENRDFMPEIVALDWADLCVGRVVWLWRSLENA